MKKIVFYLSIFVVAGMILNSCDKIDAPYTRTKSATDTTTTAVRKILLEEFTGHKCPNCPAGSLIAHDLKEAHPNQIILVSIHAGMFALPDPQPIPLGDFTYDFRTTVGNTIHDFFYIDTYPNAMISRIKSGPDKYEIGTDYWGQTVDSLLNDVPLASIAITSTYYASANKVIASVNTSFLQDLAGSYNLCVYLTEDSIVKPQINQNAPGGVTLNYVHMHVLRAAFNGAWGDQIVTSAVTAGTMINKTYELSLGSDLVPKNCHIVAFLYGGTDTTPNKYEIIQAEEKSLF